MEILAFMQNQQQVQPSTSRLNVSSTRTITQNRVGNQNLNTGRINHDIDIHNEQTIHMNRGTEPGMFPF